MKANAWHHRADAVSSVVALIGVGRNLQTLVNFDRTGPSSSEIILLAIFLHKNFISFIFHFDEHEYYQPMLFVQAALCSILHIASFQIQAVLII